MSIKRTVLILLFFCSYMGVNVWKNIYEGQIEQAYAFGGIIVGAVFGYIFFENDNVKIKLF